MHVPLVGVALYNQVTYNDTLPSDIHRPTKHIGAATAASAADIVKYVHPFNACFAEINPFVSVIRLNLHFISAPYNSI